MGKHHRYKIYDDEYQQKERPHKKKVASKESAAAVKYYKYVIDNSPYETLRPGEKFYAKKSPNGEGLQICKTAFETMLWLESALKKIANNGDGVFYAVYQVKPLGPITEHQYTTGLTMYSVASLEIVDICTPEDLGKQIKEEIKNKVIPSHNHYSADFEFATAIYDKLNAYKRRNNQFINAVNLLGRVS